MKTDKLTEEPDDNAWPPPPSTERPAAEPVAETEKFPIAQVAMGLFVGVVSPIWLTIVILIFLDSVHLSPKMIVAKPLAAIIFLVQLTVFAYQRKKRRSFAKAYLVTSSIVGIVWCWLFYIIELISLED